MLLNWTDKAISEPDAVQVLLDGSLPNDVSFQLKVSKYSHRRFILLIGAVPFILGSSQPHNSRYLFLARLPQPSLHPTICHESSGKSFRGCNVLLCPTDRAMSTLRCVRLR